ncbi:MAG: hypothetical protein RIR45_508 [Pseudomonadota bacterium]|jgi:riboflavin synthase alpha subunit
MKSTTTDRLGGHLVSGHVDGVGSVQHFAQVGESWDLRVLAPQGLAKYLAYKGSITVNGVSLTANQVNDVPTGCELRINLIPHTVQNTALRALRAGTQVNLGKLCITPLTVYLMKAQFEKILPIKQAEETSGRFGHQRRAPCAHCHRRGAAGKFVVRVKPQLRSEPKCGACMLI